MPVGEPVKLQILTSVQTALEGITAGVDYYTSVRSVTRAAALPIEIDDTPAIIITPVETIYDTPTQSTLSVHAHYHIRLTLVARTRSDPSEVLERFIRDVHKALIADVTRGGLAVYTRVLEDAVFYPTSEDEPVAVADCLVDVYYRTLRNDLNTQT